MRVARRVEHLPPYLFAELDRKIAERRASGVDVISLGVGDPDQPTPEHVVEAARRGVADASTHQYPSYYGMPEFRRAVATWFRGRFGVELDPDTEVLPLLGSKEGLAHLAFAYLDPGDSALVPDPGYPVYATATQLAGAEVRSLPLPAAEGFLPDWSAAAGAVDERTKLVWLNFPTNPTAAVASEDDLARAVAFAAERDLLLAHDAAYSEITFDGYVAPSVLQVEGGRDVAVEFHSLSKGYNMTGWRIGFAVGAAPAVKALATLKTNLDSGIFNAVQMAGVAALTGPQDHVAAMRDLYRKRRDLVVGTLNRLGWDLEPPLGSIYVWLPTPGGETSAEFADLLLDRAGVVVAPGLGYGSNGEGYVRVSLTVADDRLAEAMDRIAAAVGR
ncbi:MAG TPA: LL-diaminopimelate aminotransferase [Actinomycetota bacterium]|jgi:LL-diaminopimelate aminotransferase